MGLSRLLRQQEGATTTTGRHRRAPAPVLCLPGPGSPEPLATPRRAAL